MINQRIYQRLSFRHNSYAQDYDQHPHHHFHLNQVKTLSGD